MRRRDRRDRERDLEAWQMLAGCLVLVLIVTGWLIWLGVELAADPPQHQH